MPSDLKELLCDRVWTYNLPAHATVVFYEDGKGLVDLTMGVRNLLRADFTWRQVSSSQHVEEKTEQDQATATSRFKMEITLLKTGPISDRAADVHGIMYEDRIFDPRTFEIALDRGRWELTEPEVSDESCPYGRRITFEPSILPEAENFKKGQPRKILANCRFWEWKSLYSENLNLNQ